VTTYNWIEGQFPTSITNALVQTETRSYDPRFGGVVTLTGPNNLATIWSYDSFGRKQSETRADGTVSNWFYERCADLAGACPSGSGAEYRVRVTATGAPSTSTYYDTLDREVRTETQGFDGTLVRKDTAYDGLGRVSQTSRPYYVGTTPVWTLPAYDVLGRVVRVEELATSSERTWTTTDYNGLITTVTVSNAGAGTGLPGGVTQTRTTTKNSQAQVVQVKDTQNNTLVYTYDEFGNLKTTTDALGNVTTLSYDLRGRKTQTIDPDMGTWTYGYNAASDLIRQTDAKIQTASMSYDKLARMTNRAKPPRATATRAPWSTTRSGVHRP
jgi:YD repeat-containing protein